MKTHKKFFKSPRLEIGRILIQEMEKWESTDKVKSKEFYQLVDRLAKLCKK